MISISKLLCGLKTESDGLRYDDPNGKKKQIKHRGKHSGRPVVVWNSTVRCNLGCKHCYAAAEDEEGEGELSTSDAKKMIMDLADYGVPVLIFSGGEPLIRDDLFELIQFTKDQGIRAVISTNGTLLDRENVDRAVKAGADYIGVSVDGVPEVNDEFRGEKGAFDRAVKGIRNSLEGGLKTGLRYTITEYNMGDMEKVINMLREVGVDRYCFYHLDYSGRGEDIKEHDLSRNETRQAVRKLFTLTESFHQEGFPIEVLTVGNYVDAPFLYLYVKENYGEERAQAVYQLLKKNGGDGTGERISAIDAEGEVHPNQFWRSYSFGNIKERSFGDIWEDTSDELMKGLKNKEKMLKGKCADCQFSEICRGGSRLRALKIHGDVWKPDPKCYLREDEIR